jgi:hypothetical protein
MIDHNVMRFHVPVHDTFAVAVVQALEQLIDIVSNIDIIELRVEASEVGVINVFEYEGRCLALHYQALDLASYVSHVPASGINEQRGLSRANDILDYP